MPITERRWEYKDRNGDRLVVGCLVRRYTTGTGRGRTDRGWVQRTYRDKGRNLIDVRHEVSGGVHTWRCEHVVVVRPSNLQRARRTGTEATMKDASQKLRRARKLQGKKVL